MSARKGQAGYRSLTAAALMAGVLLAVPALRAQPVHRAAPRDQAEGLWSAHDYDAANNAFRDLVAAQPTNLHAKVRWGRLLLERFNRADAAGLFQEVLAADPKNGDALLGMALVASESFEGQAADFAHKALEADPKLTEAQELLARLALEENDSKDAREEADRALKMDAHSLTGEAVHASADLIEHEPADNWLSRMATEHPSDGRGYELIGYFLQINRRYEDGIAYFRKAIAVEPDLWSAHSQLGLNLMRLGREEEARKELELSYNNHYRDDPTVNTLRLMDSYKNFKTFRTSTTILKLDKKEADVLRLYMEPEFERALATYQKKYEFKLPRPVQLEVYANHDDFAVRTMGMPGLGLLGVTFQDVVAMDSPSGRPPGEFHWAATMWHELSHVYVLSITNQRVPRWFTEGVAVHEETQASPDWGDRLTPDVVSAIKNKQLLPVEELDRGVIHPKFPNQVVVSYYEGGKICDFISRKWGEHKLLDMVHAFAKTDSTAEVIQSQLGITPAEFDKQFLAALESETKPAVENLDKWQKDMKALHQAIRDGKADEIAAKAKAVHDEFINYVDAGDAYEAVAGYFKSQGNEAAETNELRAYSKLGGRNPSSLKELATLLSKQGKTKESAEVLERLIYIAPLDEDLHSMLGERYLALNNADGAEREYRALIAGKSQDPAAAHFGLARALRLAHKDAEAKDELLESLEAAPGFKPAQKMLLEMTGNPASD
jgi:tetratricopeptide (TPR) repeat protein